MHMKRTDMEGAQRRPKSGRRGPRNSESRVIAERRPLFTTQLAPPNYEVPAQLLVDSFIEKECRYAGCVSEVGKYVDATNRTDILREIDRGKREKTVWKTNFEHDAVFSISVHNIKISKRDGEEDLLLRLPIHEIEAMAYIKDDDQHILCIKHGNICDNTSDRDSESSEPSKLAVLTCDSRGSAEELCALLNQCFHLVYTHNTLRLLEDTVNDVAAGMSISSSTLRSEPNSKSKHESATYESKPLGFLSQSSLDLANNPSTVSSSTRSLPRRNSNSASQTGNGTDTAAATSGETSSADAASEQLLQDYTRRLYNKLNISELRQFNVLMKSWHMGMPFKEFCDQVLELYGPDRKHLITGMRPFIPKKNLPYFEAFVERLGLHHSLLVNPMSTGAGPTTPTPNFRNLRSGLQSLHNAGLIGTGTGQPDDYDRMLNHLSVKIDNLASHVTNSDSPQSNGNT